MNLYIRLKNGQPFEHPLFEDNFVQAFPDVDLANLPEWVIPFNRTEIPVLGVYEVYEGSVYVIVNGVATDNHIVRPMTDAEKIAKQDRVKASWNPSASEESWVFNPETCQYESPSSGV
jgi:hypothetical protein